MEERRAGRDMGIWSDWSDDWYVNWFSPINTYPCTPLGVATNIKKNVWMCQKKYVLISGISSLENILLVLSLELRVLITCLAALPSLCDGQVSLTIYDYVSRHRLLCLPSVKFCFDFVPWHRLFFVFFTHVSQSLYFSIWFCENWIQSNYIFFKVQRASQRQRTSKSFTNRL